MIHVEIVPGLTKPELVPVGDGTDAMEPPTAGIEIYTLRSAQIGEQFAVDVITELQAMGLSKPGDGQFVRVYLTDEHDPHPGNVAALIKSAVTNQ